MKMNVWHAMRTRQMNRNERLKPNDKSAFYHGQLNETKKEEAKNGELNDKQKLLKWNLRYFPLVK